MCGIVAILSRPGTREAPSLLDAARRLSAAAACVEHWSPAENGGGAARVRDADDGLERACEACEAVRADLRGFAGLKALLDDGEDLVGPLHRLGAAVRELEAQLDRGASALDADRVERLNALLVRLKDAHYQLAEDRLGNLPKIRELAPDAVSDGHWRVAYDLNVALNALDRLEVRGRDSAGIHLLVHGLERILPADLEEALAAREAVRDFRSGAVRRIDAPGGGPRYSFVYKVAAEVGRLGDNVRGIRNSIAEDELLHTLLACPGVHVDVLGHTRWASVGVVSEENAHPLNADREDGRATPYVVAALNGDVDNFASLVEEDGLSIAPTITTDAKVIPALVATLLPEARSDIEAFRSAVARMDGSVAIAAAQAAHPGRLDLALRGSGQALYVGLADGAFIVASEPYGIVEEARTYLRLDGETPLEPARPATRGQIVVLDAAEAGELSGIQRLAYDGTPLPVGREDLKEAEITTRDVDRAGHPHYLRKELTEAPDSIRKTLRGRLVGRDGALAVRLDEQALPEAIRQRLADGAFRTIRVIGQGTAAVAGQGVADAIREALKALQVRVEAQPATEVSGFHLRDDMRDELIVAISQSGTTTDTNRTVDLLRARGASVIGIVNRRQSDLTERVDGVIYTSDGRDVEMSVASTKAFYGQIAAGVLLGEALADAAGASDAARKQRVLTALRALPDLMRKVIATEDRIAAVARETAPGRMHWALVGNGRNRVAAEEIRIKLSELCYKAIPCDATEDKKHIDLSSEPLILVCAAGIERGNAVDVDKEVEIFAAHKACPVVIASEDGGTWRSAAATLTVPDAGPELTFILTTMVGHLFGYHAALSIDALARPLREARASLETVLSALDQAAPDPREQLRGSLGRTFRRFCKDLEQGRGDAALDAKTTARLGLAQRYALGMIPLEYFADDFGRPGTPSTALDELVGALTMGIESLTRPIDAIKHQAKTVTVGISRGDEALLGVPLVRAVLDAGADMEHLAYADLRELQVLDRAVAEVMGFTRYAIERRDGLATIRVVDRGGVATKMPSRTKDDATLRGTKNTVAEERRVLVAVGRSDDRTILLVPERDRGACTGIVLFHVKFDEDLPSAVRRAVLSGYRGRYARLRDALAESGTVLRDDDLARIPMVELLTQPVLIVADRLMGRAARV